MCITLVESWRVARCVRRSATRLRCNAAARAGALAIGAALFGACVEGRALFEEYEVTRIMQGADGGVETVTDALPPSVPEVPSEAPPMDAELSGMDGATPTSEPTGASPPESSELPDAGTSPPDDEPLASDACGICLSIACPEAIQTCRATPGCEAISACAQRTGCVDDECYCGTVDRVVCVTTGQGNGPCLEVTLAAPGAHEPTPVAPNAGVAAEAARSVGSCRRETASCRDVCGG
jgi:hypothetical protein